MSVRDTVDDRLMFADIAGQLLGEQSGVAAKVGRFVILDEIGAGGMGRVYRAYDPELDRRVAVKVLLAKAGTTEDDRKRLRREAVALAKLSHPNVVTVHEVGTSGTELFVAMEYVEGGNLATWSAAHPVGEQGRLEQALRLLRQAGRGLAAAHAVDLVHRDFKPSNVLVGEDGRVRVADFGLARPAGARGPVSSGDAPADAVSTITQAGVTVGTPRYMPPEQSEGGTVDARTDQFAFCVTAWEVLLGKPPWPAWPRLDEPPPAPDGAPGWLVDVLRHGLSAEPDARFPDMDALLRRLDRRAARGRRRVVGAVALVGVATAAGVAVMGGRSGCKRSDAVAQAAAIWGDPRREQLRERFAATLPDTGPSTFAAFAGGLDAYLEAWADHKHATCKAAEAGTSELAAEDAARRDRCLEGRRRAAAALVDALSRETVDAPSVAASWSTVGRLPSIEQCEHAAAEEVELPGDPALAAQLTELRQRAVELSVVVTVAPSEEVDAATQALIEDAEATDLQPAIAVAYDVAAGAAATRDRPDTEALAERAFLAATRAGLHRVAAQAAQRIALRLSISGASPERARDWLEIAAAHAAHHPDDHVLHGRLAKTRAAREVNAGNKARAVELYDEGLERARAAESVQLESELLFFRGWAQIDLDFDAAEKSFDEAQAVLAEAGATAVPQISTLQGGHAVIALRRGDYHAAKEHASRSYDAKLAVFGPDDVHVGRAAALLGDALAATGDAEASLTMTERALEVLRDHYGEHHRETILRRATLAARLKQVGRLDDAAAQFERAVAQLDEGMGDELRAHIISNFSVIRRRQGRHADALAMVRDAQRFREKTKKADSLAFLHNEAALNLLALDRPKDALVDAEKAVTAMTSVAGEASPVLAPLLETLGAARLATGDRPAAALAYRRSIELAEARPNTQAASRLGYAQFGLARALSDPDEARAARAWAETHAPNLVSEVDAWLAR